MGAPHSKDGSINTPRAPDTSRETWNLWPRALCSQCAVKLTWEVEVLGCGIPTLAGHPLDYEPGQVTALGAFASRCPMATLKATCLNRPLLQPTLHQSLPSPARPSSLHPAPSQPPHQGPWKAASSPPSAHTAHLPALSPSSLVLCLTYLPIQSTMVRIKPTPLHPFHSLCPVFPLSYLCPVSSQSCHSTKASLAHACHGPTKNLSVALLT